MADSEIIAAIKSLQTHLESQLLATNTTLQQFMTSVDSRFARLSTHQLPPPPPPPGNQALRSMKMEVPRFDGTDPDGWIFRVEEFFNFNNTPEATRLQIVSFHMEGKAASWFQWMKVNHLLSTWPVFLHSVRHRFGGSLYEDPQGALSKLRQTSSVAEFQTEFEALMNKVQGISESLLVSFFVTGLKADIQRELSLSKPSSLMEAFSCAKAYEARLEEARAESQMTPREPLNAIPLQSVAPSSPPMLSSASGGSRPTSVPLLPAPTTPALPIKKFSLQELREKREKGICYNCDNKWSSGHKCRSRFLFLFGTDDVEETPADSPSSDSPLEETILGDISTLRTLSGSYTPKSIQLSGSILDHNLSVLIDNGSTHNFLHPSIAQLLNLPVEAIQPFRVFVGNGDYLDCKQLCPKVPLLLQGHKFVVDLYLLNVEGPSLVLGMEWLQCLGQVTHDYSNQSLEFLWEGKKINLQAEVFSTAPHVTLHQLRAMEWFPTNRSQQVFYVLKLQPFEGSMVSIDGNRPPDSLEFPTIFQPIAICPSREILTATEPCEQMLMHWWGNPLGGSKKEEAQEFAQTFVVTAAQNEDLNLEDKVNFEGEWSVTAAENELPISKLEKEAQGILSNEPKKMDESGPIQGQPIYNVVGDKNVGTLAVIGQ